MERNWYAVYTKPGKEKKVITAFTKKRIRNYFPENKIVNEHKGITEYSPLFRACIFVYVSQAEIAEVKKISYVINFLYFKSGYAVIKKQEINLIKQVTASCINITIKKTSVDITENLSITDIPLIGYESDFMTVNYGTLKINLPSLGYTLIAEKRYINHQTLNNIPGFGKIISANLRALLTP